jgi:hypothetical protein
MVKNSQDVQNHFGLILLATAVAAVIIRIVSRWMVFRALFSPPLRH